MNKQRKIIISTFLIILTFVMGCASFATLHIADTIQGYVLNVPGYKLVMTIPKEGLSVGTNYMGGSADNPRYFYFENKKSNLIISGWFESDKGFHGINEFWKNETNAWERRGLPSPQDVVFKKINNWDTIIYDMKTLNITNSHMRAHLLQSGTWIDIHISTTSNIPSNEARPKIVEILKSIQITEIN